MRASLARQSWWGNDTTVIAGELVADGWLAARNDFYGDPARWRSVPGMAVASSRGLGHIGDRAHIDGEALAELGHRMFEAWRALRQRR